MNIAPVLRHEVIYTAKTGESDWGDPIFFDAVPLPARVEKKQRMVRSAGGNALPSDTSVLLGPEPEIKAGDRIDAGFGDGPRDVMSVDSIVDFWGQIDGWRAYL